MSYECSVCGKTLNDDVITCPKCGTTDPSHYHAITPEAGSFPQTPQIPITPTFAVTGAKGTCPACGAPLPRDQSKMNCDYCGAEIEERRTASPPSPVYKPTPEPDYTPSYSRGRHIGIGEREIIGLIIGFLLVVFLFPIAMTQISIATTGMQSAGNWNGAVAVVFAVMLPILVIIGVATKYF